MFFLLTLKPFLFFGKEDRQGEEIMIVKRKLYVMVCYQILTQWTHNTRRVLHKNSSVQFFSKTAGSLYNQTTAVPVAKTTRVPYDFLQPHELHTAFFNRSRSQPPSQQTPNDEVTTGLGTKPQTQNEALSWYKAMSRA